MTKTIRVGGKDIEIIELTPLWTDIARHACTELGLANVCPFRVCKRNRTCGTRDVLCYQILRQEVNAILLPLLQARANGGGDPPPPPPAPPAHVDENRLARTRFRERWPAPPPAGKLRSR